MTEGLHAPATLRNREPILRVLQTVLPDTGEILEIASGTGEHVTFFAGCFPLLTWQPSDPDRSACRSIEAHITRSGVPNVRPPLDLDVYARPWPMPRASAILCINMLHIAPWSATAALFAGAAELLSAEAPLYIYGPFKRSGQHTAASNAEFDQTLRSHNPAWGVRDLNDVAAAAAPAFQLSDVIAMPANNLSVIFRARGPVV